MVVSLYGGPGLPKSASRFLCAQSVFPIYLLLHNSLTIILHRIPSSHHPLPSSFFTYNRHSTGIWKPVQNINPCLTVIHLSLIFGFFYHSACVWPTALKLGCLTNFDMLFLVIGFISLVDEIQFMLISSCHICIRSIRSLGKLWS